MRMKVQKGGNLFAWSRWGVCFSVTKISDWFIFVVRSRRIGSIFLVNVVAIFGIRATVPLRSVNLSPVSMCFSYLERSIVCGIPYTIDPYTFLYSLSMALAA
jgi:hypothetical protein